MQSVSDEFHEIAQNGIRPHSWGFRASFDKAFDDSLGFFTLNVSTLNGIDILAPSDDNPIQEWDYYEYLDYTDRIVDMEWSRQIDFPYSVQSAMADFTLNNYDNYFTPDKGSPIDQYILPKRPVRLFSGFQNADTLQQFVGLTEKMPVINSLEKKAQFHALDWLSEMFTMPLNKTVAMANVTTDVVLDALFEQYGLAPTQYVLAKGRNVIPFLFFEKGMNGGDAFRQLMQSEMGNLWIDEQGIIRFEERLFPPQDPVMTFNDSNVDNIETSGDSEIINSVRITSIVRDVQEFQPIFTKASDTDSSDLFVVPANGTAVMEIDLDDPVLTAIPPTQGFSSTVSWFTARDMLNVEVPGDVSVTADELRTNTYVLTFENDNAFPVDINAMEIWGEPAKQVDQIEYYAYDEESVNAFGEFVLEIDNNMFGTESNCESFALTIIDAYKDYAGVIVMSVKGDPSLQLGDIVELDTRDYTGNYKVTKITNTMRGSRATQIITARKYTPREWFTLDVSLLDSAAVLAP